MAGIDTDVVFKTHHHHHHHDQDDVDRRD
jgi:hypothetical protein